MLIQKIAVINRFLLVILFLSACGMDTKAEVQSNTSWSGAFGNRTVDGSGDAIIDLPDEDNQCAVVQKETSGGYLKLRIIQDPEGIEKIRGDKESSWSETTADYGVVSACL